MRLKTTCHINSPGRCQLGRTPWYYPCPKWHTVLLCLGMDAHGQPSHAVSFGSFDYSLPRAYCPSDWRSLSGRLLDAHGPKLDWGIRPQTPDGLQVLVGHIVFDGPDGVSVPESVGVEAWPFAFIVDGGRYRRLVSWFLKAWSVLATRTVLSLVPILVRGHRGRQVRGVVQGESRHGQNDLFSQLR